MKIQRLLGRLAAACLFVSVVAPVASAQVRSPYPQRYPAAPVRRAPVYSNAPRPAAASEGVRFGVRAGLNVADWQGNAVRNVLSVADYAPDGSVNHNMRPGFFGGLYATIPVAPQFAIEPGLFYSEKGTVLRGTAPVPVLNFLNTRLDATARFAYLDVPVLAKVYLSKGFYLYAGPQASFLLSGKARLEASALGFSAFRQDFDVKSQFRSVDFAAVGGLGYQLDNGLGLSAGYDYGLTSLDSGNRFDAFNRVIKIGVNYSF